MNPHVVVTPHAFAYAVAQLEELEDRVRAGVLAARFSQAATDVFTEGDLRLIADHPQMDISATLTSAIPQLWLVFLAGVEASTVVVRH